MGDEKGWDTNAQALADAGWVGEMVYEIEGRKNEMIKITLNLYFDNSNGIREVELPLLAVSNDWKLMFDGEVIGNPLIEVSQDGAEIVEEEVKP